MKITFPQGYKFGYEIEFCSLVGLCADSFNFPIRDYFSLGYDSSLESKEEKLYYYEYRSKEPISSIDVDILARLLNQLKEFKCVTTRHCGLHIHISHENSAVATRAFDAISAAIIGKFIPFRVRECYCNPHFSSANVRYNALRWVPETVMDEHGNEVMDELGHVVMKVPANPTHFEVRLFNGTIKLRGIMQYFLTIKNVLESMK